MAKKKKVSQSTNLSKEDDRKLFAFLAAFLSIIGFVIALLVKRNDKYVIYYAKHSLVIFIIGIVMGAIGKFLYIFPIIGQIINAAIWVIIIIIWLLSWIYALTGEEKYIPIITEWAKKFDL
ncbi:MAG: hypothetical protein WC979_05860 [Candidatus Pacearchaeota archaeon]|jgi:uncharacterized membrane protein